LEVRLLLEFGGEQLVPFHGL